MTVADYLASYLNERGIKRVFEVAGGMITFLLDAIYRNGGVQIVSLHHEQKGPSLLQVMLDPKTDLYPKVKFGSPLSEMEPSVGFSD